jgi:type IV pilus assembly protein PilB
MSAHRERPRLGELLVGAKVINQEQLERALRHQSSWGGYLGHNLLELGLIDEGTLAAAVGHQLGLPTVDLDRAELPAQVEKLLPLSVAERYGLMPLGVRRETGHMLLACFDPTNNEAMSAARRATGLVPEVSVATPSAIDRAIRRHYYGEASSPGHKTSIDPVFHVTRHSLEPAPVSWEDRGLEDRIEELEHRIRRLEHLVDSMVNPVKG